MKDSFIKRQRGVISLEACIVVPIFIFLVLFFYGFMYMFAGQQMISHAIIQSANSLSLDSYSSEKLDKLQDGTLSGILNEIYQDSNESTANFYSNELWYKEEKDETEEHFQGRVQKEIKNRFVVYLSGGDNTIADEKLVQFGVKNGLDGISFEGSSVDDGVLNIKISYTQSFLMDAFDSANIKYKREYRQTMWQ